jgi:tetratricopeptide (TPR) repeat protein
MNQQESSTAEKAQLKHLELASRPGLRALIPDADALSTLEPAPEYNRSTTTKFSGSYPEPLTAHEVSNDLGYDEYYSTMPLAELNSVIKAGERAVPLITNSGPEAAEALDILSYLLCTRYKITGKKQDIDKAIDLGEKAVASTASVAECFQVDLANILNNLGYSLQSRFHNFGALSDLHRSIEVGEQALAMAQTGSIAHVYCMHNLASRLYSRYQKTDEAADQERAIGLCKKALAGLAKEDPARSIILMTLSRFCSDRYRKIGFWADIDEAIRLGRDALAAIPEDHHERGEYLHNLGISYFERYNLSKNAKDLEEALPILRTAVEKLQNTAYCRDLCLDSYLRALEANFLRTGAVQDIREAINVLRKHISSMQTGVALQTRKLQYGRILSSKFKSTGDIADLIFLIHAVMEAMQAETDGEVLDRILEALSFLQHSLLRMVLVPTYNIVRDTMMKTLHAGYVKHSDKGFPEAIVEFLKGNDIIDFKFYLGPPDRSGIEDPGIQQAIMEVVEVVDKVYFTVLGEEL